MEDEPPPARAVEYGTMAARLHSEEELKETDRFVTLEGTVACLLEDFNIAGVSATHDAQRTLPR